MRGMENRTSKSVAVHYRIDERLFGEVEAVAGAECEGNVSMALRRLAREALDARKSREESR